MSLIHGDVEPAFEQVRVAFERSFEKGELGAAVCAYVDGRKVVDLWGGWADGERTRPWERDTIAFTASATKGMTTTCALRLVDRGVLDIDESVASYWPEFAQGGKQDITVRMVLTHQAGLPWWTVPTPPEKRLDWETATDALARSTPVWEPGTRSEYHGGTFGYLVGKLVECIDGRRLSTFFREEIAQPLGADYLIEVGAEDDRRCATTTGPEEMVGASNSRAFRAAGQRPVTAPQRDSAACTQRWRVAANWMVCVCFAPKPSKLPCTSSRWRTATDPPLTLVSDTSCSGRCTPVSPWGRSATRGWADHSGSQTPRRGSASGSW